MQTTVGEIERHGPFGVFYLAEDYYRSACYLSESRTAKKLHLRFGDFVIYQLHSQSIELLLKAFLREKGISDDDLRRKYRHKLDCLWRECRERGLRTKWWRKLDRLIDTLNAHVNDQTFRYYKSGFLSVPELSLVREANYLLMSAVRRAPELQASKAME